MICGGVTEALGCFTCKLRAEHAQYIKDVAVTAGPENLGALLEVGKDVYALQHQVPDSLQVDALC